MTRAPHPQEFEWDGEHMRPLSPSLANRQYVVGERYRLAVEEERSAASHNHFFASINEAWKNLPDDIGSQFPSAVALRKFALIKAGYCDKTDVVCKTPADARALAAYARRSDEYAIVTIEDRLVTIYTAKSQSTRAMGKAEFQASKDAVLNIVAGMIGVTAGSLSRNAGQAA